ncbi:thioredoxin-disulfide reductase [Desulfosudis oleivorans]|uniref:Thioredoxin reductase n=1 Tax=Desulfosudis oleivorans (strain DSM 6200 / JCM 39069 / Hxd3) TaxID=96561 RepID=A8ZZG3_DESOH|nr:thioredoxin-disulfide reductase [Desulfosudis oleivorans]ABW67316.1 thioredoxin reductase [Desulfosudis oleivorans Hxd3]
MSETNYDLVIIGGGPAGLTAGIYAARARLNAVVVEKMAAGGQVLTSDWIENYPGFPEGISGADLMMRMSDQASRLGVALEYEEITAVDLSDPVKILSLGDKTITCKAVIIASGASPSRLNVPGEERFIGRGISFCATCDAPFFRDKVVAAVGGGDTAVQESLFLTKFAKKVYLIHRRDALRATKILQERAFENKKIEFVWDSVVTEIGGGLTNVEKVTVKNVKTEETRDLAVDGCFMWVGIHPNADFLAGAVDTDKGGFILTDQAMATSVPGVFAAGDVRATPLRQIATSVGDAAIALHSAEAYIESME